MDSDGKKEEAPALACMQRGPGPAYCLKTVLGTNGHCLSRSQAPAYTIGRRYREKTVVGPGPMYHCDSDMTTKGKIHTPAASLAGRYNFKDKEVTPGPADYSVKTDSSSKQRAPVVTMTHRPKWTPQSVAPSPNAYDAHAGFGARSATGRHAPAWTLRGRSDVSKPSSAKPTPGPASYAPVQADVYLKTPARCVIQGRHKSRHDPSQLNDSPGPSAYNVYMPALGKRGVSMGIRHSAFTVPYVSDVDVM